MLMRFRKKTTPFATIGEIYNVEIVEANTENILGVGISYKNLDTGNINFRGYKNLKELCDEWQKV